MRQKSKEIPSLPDVSPDVLMQRCGFRFVENTGSEGEKVGLPCFFDGEGVAAKPLGSPHVLGSSADALCLSLSILAFILNPFSANVKDLFSRDEKKGEARTEELTPLPPPEGGTGENLSYRKPEINSSELSLPDPLPQPSSPLPTATPCCEAPASF